MLEKFLLYLIIITLTLTLTLSNGADVSQSAKVVNKDDRSVTEDKWQAIIQTYNWLAAPTQLTTTLPIVRAMSSATDTLLHLDLGKHLGDYAKRDTETYHNNIRYHGGNYGNIFIKALTSSTLLSPPSTSVTPLQSMSHVYPIKINSTMKTNNSRENEISNNNHNHLHLQQQPCALKNIEIETVYAPTRISKIINHQVQEHQKSSALKHHPKNRKYSLYTQLNLNDLANVAEPIELTNSSSSVTYWHYFPPAKHIRTHQNSGENSSSTMSFGVKRNRANKTDNILPTRLNYFITNENLIDNKITNIKKHQHQNHYHYPLRDSDSDSDIKSHKAGDKNKTTISDSANRCANAANDNKVNFNGETLLRKTLSAAQDFYENIKDKILSEINKRSNNSDSYDGTAEDYTKDDNDLEFLKSSSHQVFKQTSTAVTVAVAAAIAAAVEELTSLNMKNMLFFLPSTGEVKGHKRQTDEGHIQYTLIKSPSQAAASLSSSLQTQNEAAEATFQSTPMNDTQAKLQLQNLFTKAQIVSDLSLSSQIPTSPLFNAPIPKGLTPVVSSGRKMKKIKKISQQFLFPLLLAYKLKFMALIPLLIGGLILLVGATGLAGFFFALFAAVMSLKN